MSESPGPEILYKAVDEAISKGSSYAEARYHSITDFQIVLRNGVLFATSVEERTGIAIRVLANGALSFSSTASIDVSSVSEAVARAISQAKASKGFVHGFSEEKLGNAKIVVPARKAFDSMSIDEKIAYVKSIWEEAEKSVSNAKLSTLSIIYREREEVKEIVTSDGGYVYSRIPRIHMAVLATITMPGKGTLQRRLEYGGTGGLELLRTWRVEEALTDELKRLENVLERGVEPPHEKLPVILGSEVVGLIAHESAGHPMEADRIWGREAAQAGESYVKPEYIGSKRVGNEHATVIDDPTIPGSYGFYLYDDEAVPARPRYIYREGLINEPLHNRWSAFIFKTNSNASSRAMDYASEPIVRMANTYLTPGDWSLDEMIKETRRGVYIKSYMEWNIDDIRWGQRYVGLEAYLIENGELGKPLRNPALEFTTEAYYSSIEAKTKDLRFYAGTCGKGEPAQGVPVWFGGPDVLLKPMYIQPAPR